jgi:hypothetical protein
MFATMADCGTSSHESIPTILLFTAPATSTSGEPSFQALVILISELRNPGPPWTIAIPGLPVSRPSASAMLTATCSCLVETYFILLDERASISSIMEVPMRPYALVTP